MIVTAWNNGQHHKSGAGYGIKLSAADRDEHFSRMWRTVAVTLEGSSQEVEINIAKASFWSTTCRELISKDIGTWLRENGLAPWPQDHPPRLRLEPLASRHFLLRRP